ncbi:MAG: RluA family pseudouridine synthase [Bdellovibrionales bacterium]
MHSKTVPVSIEDANQRLDKWLATLSFIPSRSRAAELIDRGFVTLNGRALKASFKVQAGQQIQIDLPPAEPSALQPLAAPLDVLYEDSDLVVINKPSGLVVHPAAGHAQDTLVNILLHHIEHLSMGFNEGRPGIVHRLDRDTSGILVVAKNDFSHQGLADQFRAKTAHRVYWAIAHGAPPLGTHTCRTYLSRHPKDRKRFTSHPKGHGKLAITHYRVRESRPNGLSWVECRLETGRTHQIRVHLSEAGFPVAGDVIYGRRPRARESTRERTGRPVGKSPLEPQRLALHACELGFVHPRSGESLCFKLGWPKDMTDFLRAAGFQINEMATGQ